MDIAFDSSNKYTACVTGTSCTYSFTNTAGNFIANGSTSYSVNPGTVSMTWNGADMTQIGTPAVSTSTYGYLFYKANAETGTHNIVTNTSGSLTNGFYDHVLSYSGTHSVVPVANAGTSAATGDVGNTSQAITVTTPASSWAVDFMLACSNGRAYTAGANTTKRSGASDAQAHVFDTGGIANTSPWTLNMTITVGTENKIHKYFELLVDQPSTDNTFQILRGKGIRVF